MGQNKKSERIGMEKTSRDGKKAKVIEYYSCENFIIEFENGLQRKLTIGTILRTKNLITNTCFIK